MGTQRNAKRNNFSYQDNDGVGNERDSLESSENSSEAFSNRYAHQHTNNFNQITQYIQNNNNKITIIIKHDNNNNNDGPKQQPTTTEQNATPQIIYIQPAASSQPNLHSNNLIRNDNENVYNSLDDLDCDEQFYINERAIDVPDFKQNSFLVLNFNNAANKKLRRRICTPTRNLLQTIDDDEMVVKSNRNKFAKKEVKKV